MSGIGAGAKQLRIALAGRPRCGRRACIGATCAVAALATAAPAQAEWGKAQIVSASTTQQAESGTQPAISRDGRFVVFEGSYAGTTGVWRKRLADGVLEPVGPGGGDASVSADGRWVAFTTAQPLDPANDANQLRDVYVRDMELAPDAAGAYTLASARDGAAAGLAYEGGLGSVTAPRVALSADGRTVVFTVLSASDLTGGAPDATPARQVVLRRLDERRTILVSTAYDRASGQQTEAPVADGATPSAFRSTAALSADGTTVAWMARAVSDQVPVVAGEPAALDTVRLDYVEPLWRRVADGPAAPVRRITGGGDPLDPACPAGGSASDEYAVVPSGANPCDGPFALARAGDQVPGTLAAGGLAPSQPDQTPQLSADGWTAAILVAQPLRDTAVAPPRPATANAYVVDMRPGLTRRQALRPLTRWASSDFGNLLLTADVSSVALSPDGTRAAFTTPRGAFPLASPSLLDAPLGTVGDTELYDVDLARGEIRRVTRQYDGGALERPADGSFVGGAFAAGYSGDGRRIAFASEARRLLYGDGNGAVDVFLSDWAEPDAGPGQPLQAIGGPPSALVPSPRWRLGATARTRRDGRVAVEVVVPAAGRLAVSASATTKRPARKAARSALRAAGRRAARGETRRGSSRGAAGRRAPRATTVTRVVAARSAKPRRAGLVVVVLSLRRGLRPPAGGGLRATAAITFSAGGRRLRASVPVRFKQPSTRRATTGATSRTPDRRGR